MTPAIRLLKKHKIKFNIHQYQHDSHQSHYGQEAANKLGVELNIIAGQIFKTLVVSMNGDNKTLAVCVLPVDCTLDLKQAAKTLACKKIELADPQLAQKRTGYIVGGISPLGQKQKLPTLIDNSAEQYATIMVSGGKRGLEIEISPEDLATELNAKFAKLTV
ncbi:Cys-tRNA(Pro) deacylase [Gilliamella apicola]|uniref:Cys-tRNA(Pro)/Cys-tRNA(Cys) deacylase n=1 Tax=Gilliamella apicola TaxID=1196095 RepID=A0A2V4EEA7_9GAMM|nr:Cys-tRNA(Pro) deacylase [Gilliamella apicola]PXZ02786.1 Cys-tRNA(Pro) deacylase [Gilliamella apicola]